ncbi:YraN family protein [Thermovibrio sp.]
MASLYLKRKGYDIIARNFTSSYGEIDLVAFEPETKTLVFVEVRYRSSSPYHPAQTVSRGKVSRIKKTALTFLQSCEVEYEQVRFDLITIWKGKLLHLVNAF